MLNAAGVKAALGNPGPAKGKGKASSVKSVEADKEKRDRAMAKAILDHLGMETEKYRLGYTKVKSSIHTILSFQRTILLYLQPHIVYFNMFLIIGVFPCWCSWVDGRNKRRKNCTDFEPASIIYSRSYV